MDSILIPGNIIVGLGNISKFSFKDSVIKSIGPRSIIGREVVVHEKEDDLNPGGRVIRIEKNDF